MPELTTDQIRERFLKHVWGAIEEWDRENLAGHTRYSRLSGLAFTILSLLDGSGVELPRFIVAPDPHPKDQAFCEANGEDWYPENGGCCGNIAGSLHELFHSFDPRCKDRDESKMAAAAQKVLRGMVFTSDGDAEWHPMCIADAAHRDDAAKSAWDELREAVEKFDGQ